MAKKIINNKSVKPMVKVDFTKCDSIFDVYSTAAKSVLEQFCTPDEVHSFIDKYGVILEFHMYNCKDCECNKKKPNIFKRFWNWITRK